MDEKFRQKLSEEISNDIFLFLKDNDIELRLSASASLMVFCTIMKVFCCKKEGMKKIFDLILSEWDTLGEQFYNNALGEIAKKSLETEKQ